MIRRISRAGGVCIAMWSMQTKEVERSCRGSIGVVVRKESDAVGRENCKHPKQSLVGKW